MIRLLECGCCGQYHPDGPLEAGGSANYRNDCRYDANRFQSDEDFTARTGLPCVEVWLDEQEAEEAESGASVMGRRTEPDTTFENGTPYRAL